MYKGTTPTYLFKTEADLDLTRAKNIYVTFSKMSKEEIFTKTGDDLIIQEKTVGVYLTQEETLSLPSTRIQAQVNWTYEDGKRMCSQVILINMHDNLMDKVVE